MPFLDHSGEGVLGAIYIFIVVVFILGFFVDWEWVQAINDVIVAIIIGMIFITWLLGGFLGGAKGKDII